VNVLFLSHSYPREPADPVGSFVLRLAVALRDEGVAVSVVAPAGDRLPAREMMEGIPVRRFRYAPRRLETLAYTGTMLAQAAATPGALLAFGGLLTAGLAAAMSEAGRMRADVVHAHWWFPGGAVGVGVRRLRGLPLVTTLHGSDLRAARHSALATRAFRSVLAGSSAVTTVSSWLADETRQLAPGSTPIVAPMPVAPGLFAPEGPRDQDRLLFVGKLNEQKGVGHLLRAFALMRSKPGLDIVVGVGSEVEPTRSLAESLGVADRVTFHPLLPQRELARCYRRATALVAPFVDEGLGLVAIEAALSGTPVVAYSSGGLTDVVVDRRTGILVPVGDDRALATALDDLLATPDRGAALGANAREHALATFAPHAVASRYAALYRSLIAAPAVERNA